MSTIGTYVAVVEQLVGMQLSGDRNYRFILNTAQRVVPMIAANISALARTAASPETFVAKTDAEWMCAAATCEQLADPLHPFPHHIESCMIAGLCDPLTTAETIECIAFAFAATRHVMPPQVTELALRSLRSGSEQEKMPLGSAIAVIANIVGQSDAVPVAATLKDEILAASFAALRSAHSSGSVMQLITRRVVIPMSTGEAHAATTGAGAGARDATTRAKVLQTVADLVRDGHRDDTVLLIAALFDVIFPSDTALVVSGAPVDDDFRRSDLLWEVIIGALQRVTQSNEDPSKRQSLHNQVIYLLKRLVSFTEAGLGVGPHVDEPAGGAKKKPAGKKAAAPAATAPSTTLRFHEHFSFSTATSSQAWHTFFLVFETLSEYGLHLIEPAMMKLSELAAAIEPVWVEALLLKGIVHANVGCRRLTLRHLWRFDVANYVAPRLTRGFVCESVANCLADARLCVEIDSVALEGNFLGCKAFEGRKELAVPPLQPIASLAEVFYREYVSAMATDAEARDVVSRLVRVASAAKTSRFGLCVLLRILIAVRAPLMDEGLLAQLYTFVTECIEDRHAHWLEGRMGALAVEALLALSPPPFLAHPKAKAFVARCCRNGCTGGRALAAIDASGTAGNGGSAVKSIWVAQRVAHLPSAAREQLLSATLDAYLANPMTTANLADAKMIMSFPALTHVVMATSSTGDSPAAAASRQLLLDVQHVVLQQCEAVFKRPYAPRDEVHAAFNAFAELSQSLFEVTSDCVSSAATTIDALSSSRDFLNSAVDYLKRAFIERSERCMTHLSKCGGNPSYNDDCWRDVAVDDWDELTAAFTHLLRRLASIDRALVDVNLGGFIDELLRLLVKCSTTAKSGSSSEYGRIAVFRNVMRVLHSVATAHILEPIDIIKAVAAGDMSRLLQMTLTLAEDCKPLHLSVDDTPVGALTAAQSCSAAIAQSYRYHWDSVLVLVEAIISVRRSGGSAPVDVTSTADFARLRDACIAQLDLCSVANLSCIFTLVAELLPFAGTSTTEAINSMRSRMTDGMRRELFRCSAVVIFNIVKHLDPAEATPLLEELCEEGADTDRVLYFVACAVSVAVINDDEVLGMWRAYRGILFQLAMLTNTTNDDSELSACVAVTEPCVAASWPSALRASLPPIVRMCPAARGVALTAILHICHKHQSVAIETCRELVAWNTEHPILKYEPAMPNSHHHRARLRTWQTLCALLPALPRESDVIKTLVTEVIDKCIVINNCGSVRRLIELFMIEGTKRCPDLRDRLLVALRNLAARPQTTGSLALVAAHFVMDRSTEDTLIGELMVELVRMCSSHQHLLRIISHISVHDVLQKRQRAGLPLSAEAAALFTYLNDSPESKKLFEKHNGAVKFDSAAAIHPTEIFCVQRVEADQWLQDTTPASTFHRFAFLQSELASVLGCNSPFDWHRCALIGTDRLASVGEKIRNLPLVPPRPPAHAHFVDYAFEVVYNRDAIAAAEMGAAMASNDDATDETGGGGASSANRAAQDNLQRKVVSWWNSALHNELHPRALGANVKQSIIVVTTFLENPVNIAGLMRCGEIFAVEKVIVPDKSVFKHPHFVATARSAELWLPWGEVSELNLPSYLNRMRDEGYTIVGVEQTAHSVNMTKYAFPKKVVMVLGAEGQGIPANALHLLDVCVEVPQYGLIRSFNVHVTGALALYEYSKQHNQ